MPGHLFGDTPIPHDPPPFPLHPPHPTVTLERRLCTLGPFEAAPAEDAVKYFMHATKQPLSFFPPVPLLPSETLWHWNSSGSSHSLSLSLSPTHSLPVNSVLTFKSAQSQLTLQCAAAVLLSANVNSALLTPHYIALLRTWNQHKSQLGVAIKQTNAI